MEEQGTTSRDSGCTRATDPYDKFYGVMGLGNEDAVLDVNYDWEVSRLYQHFAADRAGKH